MVLFRAYNRVSMSKVSRVLRVFTEEDDGTLITTGPNSELQLTLRLTIPTDALHPPLNPAEQHTLGYFEVYMTYLLTYVFLNGSRSYSCQRDTCQTVRYSINLACVGNLFELCVFPSAHALALR